LVVASAAKAAGLKVDGFLDDSATTTLGRLTSLRRLGSMAELATTVLAPILCVGDLGAAQETARDGRLGSGGDGDSPSRVRRLHGDHRRAFHRASGRRAARTRRRATTPSSTRRHCGA
jgi:hypothetical protein